jgi:hypothetical protein
VFLYLHHDHFELLIRFLTIVISKYLDLVNTYRWRGWTVVGFISQGVLFHLQDEMGYSAKRRISTSIPYNVSRY